MASPVTLDSLLAACSDEGTQPALRITTELEPAGGAGAPVKPAVYAGGLYQLDRRWESVDAEAPADVVVIDNVPSQANRAEAALQAVAERAGLPEIVLDLAGVANLPSHLPRTLSSWQFPHRNADAYLRDALLDGTDFLASELGVSLFSATPWAAGPLVAWFPQSLAYGFWQSHLGKKRANTKLARAWASEIVGWRPAKVDGKVQGLKGDPLNLSASETVTSNADDRRHWVIGKEKVEGGKTDKLSEMGHGQVPFGGAGALTPTGISFARISQTSTLSFAQLRRIGLGTGATGDADTAARALAAAMALTGHALAFGRGFSLRSGADLHALATEATWVGGEAADMPTPDEALDLLDAAQAEARALGVPLDGWGREALHLTPKDNLAAAIRATWPLDGDV